MKLHIKQFAVATILAVAGMSFAHAQTPLTVDLKAYQVITQDGKSTLKAVTNANKGDVIQYQATYRNNIDKPMTNVAIDIPVPQSLVYTGTASPAPTHASLDGKNFDLIPLKRQVNGKWVEVPQSEYRTVRWVIKTLSPKQQSTVSINTKVDVKTK